MRVESTRLPLAVWAISLVSLLVNISASMMFSAMPTYLTNVLRVDPRSLGQIEGFLEFIAYILRVVSGVLSDFFRKRKILLAIAISMIALSRPLLAWFPLLAVIIAARVLDRLGNGLQATPREALISDHTPRPLKGAAYGLRNSMGMMGSLLGALFLWYLMRKTNNDYGFVFTLAVIPPTIGLVLLLLFVQEKKTELAPSQEPENAQKHKHFDWEAMWQLPWDYWKIIILGALFCLANPAGTFLVVHATSHGLPECDAAVVMILQNSMASLISYPVGHLSDKISRKSMLLLCSFLMVSANIVMFSSYSLSLVYVGLVLWGLQFGLNQSLLFAEIASHVPKGLRGTGFAIFYLVAAVCLYLTNAAAGYIKAEYGSNAIYAFCGSFALLGLIFLIFMKNTTTETIQRDS